jgi:RNA polymerase sigma-70 factor (ECF subfamily)
MGILAKLRGAPAAERETSDDELMRRVRAGSKEAYLAMYDRYENAVFAYCRRVLVDSDRADDVFQEAFVRVWERCDSFHGGNFEAWLFTIVRNLCHDDRERRARHEPIDTAGERAAAIDEGPDVIEREALASAIGRLAPELREALVLREYEGRSYQEIAELTGQSLSSVGVRIFRAKQQLRALLAPLKDDQR